MTFNNEQMAVLAHYEDAFRRAVEGRYLSNPGPAALQNIRRIWDDATKVRHHINGSCGRCLKNMLTDVGTLYFADKQARIDADNDKKAVELTQEAAQPICKAEIKTAPAKKAPAKKTTPKKTKK